MSSADQIESRLREIGGAAERARKELDHLIGQVEALRVSLDSLAPVTRLGAPEATQRPAPEPYHPVAETPEPGPTPGPVPPTPLPDPTPPTPDPTPPEPVPPTEPDPAPEPHISANNNDDGARLVAMKMAIDGSPREQIEAELSARFGAIDRSGLLDQVLARVGR